MGVAVLLLIALGIVLYRINKGKEKVSLLLEQQVIERTKELQLNYELILQSYQEQRYAVNKTRSDINSLLNTVRGLGTITANVSTTPDNFNFDKQIQSSAASLSLIINNIS